MRGLQRHSFYLSHAPVFEKEEVDALNDSRSNRKNKLYLSLSFFLSGRRLGVVRNRAAEQVLRVHLQDRPQADEDHQRE